MKKTYFSNLVIFFFALVISFPVILPYFHQGYFPTHDGEWTIVRLSEMFRELKDFQLPPRYSTYLNFGYGYPLFNFAYPLPYYLGIFLYLLKFGFVGSVKILFALSVPFSAFFMFFASREFWKSSLAGLVSAILYVYLPYRMVDLYARGSIGESLAFVLFPFIFFLVIKIANSPYSKVFIVTASLSYACLILTHNIMALLFSFLLFILILAFFIFGERKATRPFLLFVFFGILLSSFFWLPALLEKQFVLLSKVPIADRNLYFVKLEQFLLPSWGYGVPTEKNGFTYQLGLPHLLVFFLTLVFLIYSKLKRKEVFKDQSFKFAIILSLTTIVFIFFLFSPSAVLWQNLPLLSEINYPWTMLAPIGFLVGLLAGFLATKPIVRYLCLFLALASIFLVSPYARPQYYVDRGDSFYLTNSATTTSSSEYTPLWVKKRPFQNPSERIEILQGPSEIKNLIYRSNKISFTINSLVDSKIRVNTIYYPGWRAYVNSKESAINYSNDKGVMDLMLPKGEHDIKFIFSETPLRLFADLLSVFSFVILVIFSVKFRYGINKKG